MEWSSQEEWKKIQEELTKSITKITEAVETLKKAFEAAEEIIKELWEAIKETLEIFKTDNTEINKMKRHYVPGEIKMKNFTIIRKPEICIRNTC